MPVFIVTAYDSPDLRKEARKFGVTEVIGKPFQPDQLLHKIRTAITHG
jgi:DNA-binding response OmpR family regulator